MKTSQPTKPVSKLPTHWFKSKLALGYAFWKLQAKTVKIERKHWRKTSNQQS